RQAAFLRFSIQVPRDGVASAQRRPPAAASGLPLGNLLPCRSVLLLHRFLNVWIAHDCFSPLLFRNLHKIFRRDRAVPRAALFVKESQHLAQCVCVRRIPKKRSRPSHIHQPHLPQFLQVMRQRRRGNPQLFLNLPRHHPGRVRREQQAHNLQPRFRPNGGKAVCAASDNERIGFFHISIVAEIRKRVNLFFSETLPTPSASYFCPLLFFETPAFFAFDRVSVAWDTEKTNS